VKSRIRLLTIYQGDGDGYCIDAVIPAIPRIGDEITISDDNEPDSPILTRGVVKNVRWEFGLSEAGNDLTVSIVI